MNKNNILIALMETFELDINQMAKFCCFDLKTMKEYRRLQNYKFINGELSSLYFFFGVDTYEEIYNILFRMNNIERKNILLKIKAEIN